MTHVVQELKKKSQIVVQLTHPVLLVKATAITIQNVLVNWFAEEITVELNFLGTVLIVAQYTKVEWGYKYDIYVGANTTLLIVCDIWLHLHFLKVLVFILAEILKKNADVDIAFMLDATSSMEENLEAVEQNIAQVVMKVKDTFSDIKVRVALVAYRDYSEASLHFEILDFTENVTNFIHFIRGVRAFYGGDIPEDVLGALDQTINLEWKAANKLFFQIGNFHKFK